ncbi:NADPH dehydrogenase NamA [Anaerovorax odorimutans]|uniref:NADPH dehydrogenase NamA n=1 Tax=Anaerovorax odorimutans TaxID=109327 RepID=A0ABT1RSY9_9FIRM|nr:NADPH dehydrogenase NamA [Anaerovorax odorimutans]MCQ4638244.1 NADPH dehydrogenase NamA [Anaerovorax odorimutans]
MSKLFQEFKLKNLTLKNRIVMPPMCMYCAGEDGMVTQWHVIHYGTRAVGGAGLLLVEATGVCPEGRISSEDLGLWNDDQIEGMKRLVEAVHDNGARIGIQLNHAGRKCTAEGMDIEAPSPIPFDDESATPREMTASDIDETVEQFRQAAARAEQAGFDLIEIHGAHGYLLSEFLSPLTNKRDDQYGGSAENRVRFLGRVVDAVKTVWPEEKPLQVRVSAEDYEEGGNRAEDLGEMLNLIKGKGIDIVNVSTGGVVSAAPKAVKGYQIPHGEVVKTMTGLPVIAGGLVTEAQEAEEIIASGKADLVYIGRELLRSPYWPLKAAGELGADIPWPKQYERAKR